MYLEPPKVLDEDVSLLHSAPLAGVYFLCQGDKIVYIGASQNVYARIHNPDVDKGNWDRVYVLPVPEHDMLRIRKMLVLKYQPRFNLPEVLRAPLVA